MAMLNNQRVIGPVLCPFSRRRLNIYFVGTPSKSWWVAGVLPWSMWQLEFTGIDTLGSQTARIASRLGSEHHQVGHGLSNLVAWFVTESQHRNWLRFSISWKNWHQISWGYPHVSTVFFGQGRLFLVPPWHFGIHLGCDLGRRWAASSVVPGSENSAPRRRGWW